MNRVKPERLRRLYQLPAIHLRDVLEWVEGEYTTVLEHLAVCSVDEVISVQGQAKSLARLANDLKDVRDTKKDK